MKSIRFTNYFLVLALCAISALWSSNVIAQEQKDVLIQFSGVLLTADSLESVPFANIIIKNSHRGTISDYFGYFSFVAEPKDTIVFSYVGFKDSEFVIPDTLKSKNYSLIQMMSADTFPSSPYGRACRPVQDFASQFVYHLLVSENFKFAMQQNSARLYYAGQLPPNNLLNPLAWARFIKAWKNGDFKRKKKK